MPGNRRALSFLQLLRDLWARLTEPSPAVREVWARRQARLVAALLLALVVIVLLTAVMMLTPSRSMLPEPVRQFDLLVMIGFGVLLALLYGLGRSRRHQWAAVGVTALVTAATFFIAYHGRSADGIQALMYMVAPVLLASMFFSPKVTALAAAVNLLGMSLLYQGESYPLSDTPQFFLLTVTALVLIAMHHRTQIFRDQQTQLAESEQYRQLVDHLPDAICICAGGSVAFSNTACARLFGLVAPEQLVRRQVTEFVPQDNQAHIELYLRQAEDGQATPFAQCKLCGFNGDNVDVELRTLPFTYQGKSAALLIARDITAPKQVEQVLQQAHDELEQRVAERTAALVEENAALAEERNLLRNLVDTIPDGISVKDWEGRFILVNDAVARLFEEESPEAVIGKRDFDYYSTRSAAEFYAVEQRVMQSRRATTYEEFEQMLTTKTPLLGTAGAVIGVITISRDISHYREAKAALAAERTLLRAVIDNIPDTISVKDLEGRFILVNDAVARMLEEENPLAVIGKTDADYYSREEVARFQVLERRVVESGYPLAYEEAHQALVTKTPLRDSHGDIVGLVTIGRDIHQYKQAEVALAEERNVLRTLIDSLPDRIFVKDTEGRFMVVNRAVARLHDEETPEAVIGKTDFDYFSREAVERFWAAEQKVMQSGQMVQWEEPAERKGGDRWVWLTKVPLRDVQGNVVGVIGINRDITEQKRTEAALRAERNLLRTIIDNLPDRVYVKDTQSRYMLVNQIALHSRNLRSNDDIAGKTDFDLFPKEQAEVFFADEKRIMATGEPLYDKEEQITSARTGTPIWISTTKVPLYNDEGEVVGLVGIGRDVTVQKQAQARLVEERNLLRALIDNIPDLISVKDAQSRFLLANAKLVRNLGLTSEADLVGRTDFDISPADLAEQWFAQEQQVLHTGAPMLNLEESGLDWKTGEWQWFSTIKVPIHGADGRIMGLVAIVRNITAQKRVEETLQQARDELEQRVQERTAALIAANARLQQEIAERIRAETAEREQRTLAEALRDTAAALSQTLDFDEVLDRILTNVGRVVPHRSASIMLIDNGVARVARSRGYEAYPFDVMSVRFGVTETSTLRRMAESRQPLVIRDVRLDDGWLALPGHDWVDAYAGAPIFIDDDLIGFLNLDNPSIDDVFADTVIGQLQAFADQAAVAIKNARLYQAEQEQRVFAEALRDSAAALNSTLDYDELLDRILTNFERVAPYDRASIMLIEDGIARIVRQRGYPDAQIASVMAIRFSVQETDNMRVMVETGQPLAISDTCAYAGWIHRPEIAPALSYIGAPIRLGGETIGFLNLDSLTPNAFTSLYAERLRAFADQAAIAIKNARLYGESQERNRQLALLTQITRIGTATLDMHVLLQSLADSAAEIIGGDGCFITLWDAEHRRAIPVAAFGPLRDAYPAQEPSRQGQLTMTQAVLEAGHPLRIEDVMASPYYEQSDFLKEHDIRSVLTLPLRANEADLGALIITFTTSHHFAASEIAWAERAAELIALAVSKVQAYIELEQRVAKRTVELKAANERLTALSHIKDEFVANVSHELRTPITSLRLYHDLLRRNPRRYERYLGHLERETRRLEQIVEDLLYLSRMEQGQVELVPAPINLNALAGQYALDRAPLAEQKGLRLSLDIDLDAPVVQADERLIGQAFSTLLTNALSYTSAGGQVTLLTRVAERENGQWVGIGVSDTGPGIPPEEQSHVFERFYRGQAAREANTPGTGLGLSIAHEIVQRHGGEIEVISEGVPGKGATFIIWLPAGDVGQRA